MPAPLRVFHGTSSQHFEEMRAQGLRSPYVTDTYERAYYYAECETEVSGGDPEVLTFEVPVAQLRYDAPAMDEPVLAAEAARDAAWNLAATGHPEWLDAAGYLRVPATAWEVSWTGVGSARTEGLITQWDLAAPR